MGLWLIPPLMPLLLCGANYSSFTAGPHQSLCNQGINLQANNNKALCQCTLNPSEGIGYAYSTPSQQCVNTFPNTHLSPQFPSAQNNRQCDVGLQTSSPEQK